MKLQDAYPNVWYEWDKFPKRPVYYKEIETFNGWTFDIIVKYYDAKFDRFRHVRICDLKTDEWTDTKEYCLSLPGHDGSVCGRIVGFMVLPNWDDIAQNLV